MQSDEYSRVVIPKSIRHHDEKTTAVAAMVAVMEKTAQNNTVGKTLPRAASSWLEGKA